MVHAGFYVLLLGLPLTGWLIVSSSARHIPTYLYGAVPWPNIPGVNALTPALKASLNVVSGGSHEVMAYLACLAIVLHVAGALKHQLVDRDHEMTRMVPVKRSIAGPIGMIILLAAIVLAGLAATGHLSSVAAKPVHRDDQTAGSPLPARSPPSKPTPMPVPATSSPGAYGSSPADPDSAPDRATSSPVDAAEWQVRRSSSRLGFQTRWSQGPVEGGFARWEARIRFAPEALAASHVKVTVDLASVTTNSPDTQEALVGDDWFATSLHPTATFVADRFTHLAGDRYAAHGTLSLRGASRPLTLPFTLRVKGQVASMHAAVAIDRTAFGIGQGDFQSTADVPAKVQVTIDLTADRSNPHGDTK
jgi:polyisoprenoid-binding protein YceI